MRSALPAAFLLVACATAAPYHPDKSPETDPLSQEADDLIGALGVGDDVRASAHFDEPMRQALPPDTLHRAWQQSSEGLGPLVSWKIVEKTRTARVAELSFDKGRLQARVNFDPNTREVSGLHFVPLHDVSARCVSLLTALQGNDIDAVMKQAPTLSRQVIRTSWHEMTDLFGRLLSWKHGEDDRAGSVIESVYDLTFAKGQLVARIAVDARRDQVVGLHFRPVEEQLSYAAPADAPYTAEEVTIPTGGYVLAGTLLLPKDVKGPMPAVLTITGSGQQTRDEPLPIPGLSGYRPFRQIAIELASHGIAVLRVDDRGVGKSTGAETLAQATTASFADDARAEVAYLRTRHDVDPARIALVGHSEGADIAAMLAATDARLGAIVLMAGTGKPAFAVLEDQMRDALSHDAGKTPAQVDEAVASQQKQLHALADSQGDLASEPPGLPWLREFLRYDPLAMIRKVRQPVLVLQGALDHQVTADQARALAGAARTAGNADVDVAVFDGLNHLFLPATTGSVQEYASLKISAIPPPVLDKLSGWLVARLLLNRPR
jgi:dienelactone hydrolase